MSYRHNSRKKLKKIVLNGQIENDLYGTTSPEYIESLTKAQRDRLMLWYLIGANK